MNERLAKLYDQALVLEGNGDYVAGELDPVKFAELIVRECCDVFVELRTRPADLAVLDVKKHFGVEDPPVSDVDRILQTVRTRG